MSANADWKARVAAVAALLFQVGFFLLWGWGIYRAFDRRGVGHGILSVVAPPYAWYRGVASIWERPEWQENWDEMTESLGYVVADSADPRDSKQAMDLARAKANIRKWVRSLPNRERAELRYATENYVNAHTQQARNLIGDLMDGSPVRRSSDPSVAVFVQRFQNVKGLAAAWKRYDAGTTDWGAQAEKTMLAKTPEERAEIFRRKQLGLQATESGAALSAATVNEIFAK